MFQTKPLFQRDPFTRIRNRFRRILHVFEYLILESDRPGSTNRFQIQRIDLAVGFSSSPCTTFTYICKLFDVQILGPRPGDKPTLEERVEQFIQFATKAFDRSMLKDRHEGLVHFHVPSSTEMTWSKIFGTMERAKSRPTMWIEDYSVSQTTLEQVFINLARAQHAP
jgi:hypothetical protein